MASADAISSYREVPRDEAVCITDGVRKHAAHVMLYANVNSKLFGRYDIKHAILVRGSYNLFNMMRTYIHTYVCI